MYRIKTIKEIEAAGYDLKKIPKEVFDNIGVSVEYIYVCDKDLGKYATYDKLPQPYPAIIRVINAMEWEQKHKHVKPASDLKPWLGIELHHNAHLRFDCVGNFWFWETATNAPNYISSQFIIRSDNMMTSVGNINRNGRIYGESVLDTLTKLPEGMMVKNMTEDLFKLETETEYKINLNQNSSYIAKRDVAGYKKGDILSYQKVDALTGDPLVIDLNTGKEIRIGYHDYEQRSNTEYLKMKQDN